MIYIFDFLFSQTYQRLIKINFNNNVTLKSNALQKNYSVIQFLSFLLV